MMEVVCLRAMFACFWGVGHPLCPGEWHVDEPPEKKLPPHACFQVSCGSRLKMLWHVGGSLLEFLGSCILLFAHVHGHVAACIKQQEAVQGREPFFELAQQEAG